MWYQPETSREPRPPKFSSGLHPGPTAQRDMLDGNREEEGPGLLAMLEVVSFFLHSSHLRNVPGLGAGNPGLSK